MSAYHKVYLKDGQFYLDDMPLRGVRDVNMNFTVNDTAECQISLYMEVGDPTVADFNQWTKERMVREEEWKKMMTTMAQELLDGLS